MLADKTMSLFWLREPHDITEWGYYQGATITASRQDPFRISYDFSLPW